MKDFINKSELMPPTTVSDMDKVVQYRDALCALLVQEPPRHPGGQKKQSQCTEIALEIMQCNQWLKYNFKLFFTEGNIKL
jgi:hypothetical protein